MTAASKSNLGMLMCLIGATLHLPIKKEVSTSVAKLGTVFKYATAATATDEASTNIWTSVYGVLFNVSSGEERNKFNFF